MNIIFDFLFKTVQKASFILLVLWIGAFFCFTGCNNRQANNGDRGNNIGVYRVTWWNLPDMEGSKSGNFGRPDYGVINIDNGELNLRHAILEGRDLGDYRLPYWPIRSFVSIFDESVEIAQRCTVRIESEEKEETFLFRTGNPDYRLNAMSSRRVKEGFDLAKIGDADVLKVSNRGSDSPVLIEHFFVIEPGSNSIPVYVKAINTTDKTIQNVEIEIAYSQDFNWSSFGISTAQNYQQIEAPESGTAKAFYAFSSGMESGFEFQQNEGCELFYTINKEFNAWDVELKNIPVALVPGGSLMFSYDLSIIDKPPKQTIPPGFVSNDELNKLEFTEKIPTETKTAPTNQDKKVTIQDVIQNLEKPKVRGFGYLTGDETAGDNLSILKDWGGNLVITRSEDPDIIAYGHDLGIEMLLRGQGSYKTGEVISFQNFFSNELEPDEFPDSYGQDEDHYYWYPVSPTLDFENEFGKPMSGATLEEKVDYWNRCFVDKWRMQLEHIREYDPDGDIWFYAPSPGMPFIDPLDYYDTFFSEVSKLGDELTVFPFYYGIDFDMPEYMMRRWKEAGVARAVFLPGGPTYSKPSQFMRAITSARRGGADGTCGFAFTLSDEFDDEWRWKSLLLAAQANFPTAELGAYCFVEEPVELIEKLAISDINIVSGRSDGDDVMKQLNNFFPGRINKVESLPQNPSGRGELYLVVDNEPEVEQIEWPYDTRGLEPGKGVIQMTGNVVRVSGSDTTGLQNAKELVLRFAELALAENQCKELIGSE